MQVSILLMIVLYGSNLSSRINCSRVSRKTEVDLESSPPMDQNDQQNQKLQSSSSKSALLHRRRSKLRKILSEARRRQNSIGGNMDKSSNLKNDIKILIDQISDDDQNNRLNRQIFSEAKNQRLFYENLDKNRAKNKDSGSKMINSAGQNLDHSLNLVIHLIERSNFENEKKRIKNLIDQIL
uniref:Uncharacterized protein n=1 Tax=Romanomermis culicivorax TaxID=13658 RepID=A0A915KFH7_ROMCU